MALKTKIPPPLVALLFLGVIYLSKNLLSPFEFYFQYFLAAILVAVGLIFSVSGLLELRKRGTTPNPINPNAATKLVTGGIFKVTRNPMYLGLVFYLVAGVIFLGAYSGILLVPLFIFYLTHFQIGPEEEAMEKLFKKEFREYCAKVRRWI